MGRDKVVCEGQAESCLTEEQLGEAMVRLREAWDEMRPADQKLAAVMKMLGAGGLYAC